VASTSAADLGPVLRYTFDEPSGGFAMDSGIQPGANAGLAGGATLVPSSVGAPGGSALDLTANNGKGNWIIAGDADKLDAMPSLTVLMWVNLRGTPSNTAILAADGSVYGGPGGAGGWDFIIGGNPASAGFGIEIWAGTGGTGQSNTKPLDADHKWVMLAGTFNPSTHAMNIYGGSISSPMSVYGAGTAFGGSLLDNTGPFLVGNAITSPQANWVLPAWIDEVQIYNRALTLNELEAVRQSTAPEPRMLIGMLTPLYLCCRQKGRKKKGAN
jgi:hypothetical protein